MGPLGPVTLGPGGPGGPVTLGPGGPVTLGPGGPVTLGPGGPVGPVGPTCWTNVTFAVPVGPAVAVTPGPIKLTVLVPKVVPTNVPSSWIVIPPIAKEEIFEEVIISLQAVVPLPLVER